MGILFDTSYLIDLERGGTSIPRDEEVGMAAITLSELLQGILRANPRYRATRQAWLESVLTAVEVFAFDERVARVHAAIWADLARAGRPVGAHDLQIAATALSLGWQLATTDLRGFRGLRGLTLWTAEG